MQICFYQPALVNVTYHQRLRWQLPTSAYNGSYPLTITLLMPGHMCYLCMLQMFLSYEMQVWISVADTCEKQILTRLGTLLDQPLHRHRGLLLTLKVIISPTCH